MVLRIELKKAIRSWWFLCSLVIGLFFVAMSANNMLNAYISHVNAIKEYVLDTGYLQEDPTHSFTLYNSWIGGEMSTLSHTLFYTLLPLLAVLPTGWSFSNELNTNYLHTIIHRCGRKRYFISKIETAIITGGLVVVIPQVVSFLLISLFVPGIMPRVIYLMYYPVEQASCFSALYYSYPVVCFVAVMIMDFVFGGMFACLSMTTAFFFRQRVAAVVVPFLFLLGADLLKSFLYYVSYLEISPINMLHPLSPMNILKWPVVITWFLILFFLTVPIIIGKGQKHEVF